MSAFNIFIAFILNAFLSALLANGKDIVCSYSDWARWRPGRGKYTLDNFDPKLCTIINYSFASLDDKTLTVMVKDTDFLNQFSQKIPSLKRQNRKLKALLAMGGWSDSKDGNKYARLVSSKNSRKNFIEKAIQFLKQHEFDGLDLNWEYPVCWHAKCDDSRRSERINYGIFAQELRSAFDKNNLMITASVSGSQYIIDRAYDVPAMARALHMINVLTYDFAGTYRGKTSHNSALYYKNGDDSENLNIDSAMKHWVEKGAPKSKLSIGVPLFGRSFTLAEKDKNGLYSPIKGEGKVAQYTNQPGYMGYNEICELVKDQAWTVKRVSGVGPYAYKDDQWVSYDDPKSAAEKAKYARDNGYAGIKIWEVTHDDFNAYCCNVKNPMLRALNYGLTGKGMPPNEMVC